jgi:uncharacterized protein YdiU (UPF0061 family)
MPANTNKFMHTTGDWNFDNSYTRLPGVMFSEFELTSVRAPRIAIFNHALAESMGLDASAVNTPAGAMIFAGNAVPPGAEPIAQAYAGHQYGNFTMLGDGRAALIGEHLTPDGVRLDIQWKGSGPTSYSRRGDGRAALGPMLREYIISEAMHALGIPTTRSLAVTATGERVAREMSLAGAVLTRVAASHIRVGTFEFASSYGDPAILKSLTDYTIRRHYPALLDQENPTLRFLEAVIDRQAALLAQWLLVGFIHGVMNTDNMAISGETIDYGPCAFMDSYDPSTVFSSIDRHGRYAFGNQPNIAQWNLARFAETLLPLIDPDEKRAVEAATTAINAFPQRFDTCWRSGMRAKLGIFSEEPEDVPLMDALLRWMSEEKLDYTNTFRSLGDKTKSAVSPAWMQEWQARLGRQPQAADAVTERMRAHNPAVIPRNHKVEEALQAAVESDDLSVLHRLLRVLAHPYDDVLAEDGEFQLPAGPDGAGYQTYCGT